jgi:hypothetical protein
MWRGIRQCAAFPVRSVGVHGPNQPWPRYPVGHGVVRNAARLAPPQWWKQQISTVVLQVGHPPALVVPPTHTNPSPPLWAGAVWSTHQEVWTAVCAMPVVPPAVLSSSQRLSGTSMSVMQREPWERQGNGGLGTDTPGSVHGRWTSAKGWDLGPETC